MTFDDLQTGDTVFVDANIFIYHFTNHAKYGAACTRLLERIELKELIAFTASNCLADVAHRLMTIEAMGRMGWPLTTLAARLKKHHAEIPKLYRFINKPQRRSGNSVFRSWPFPSNSCWPRLASVSNSSY